VIHYEEALYQVYACTFTFTFTLTSTQNDVTPVEEILPPGR